MIDGAVGICICLEDLDVLSEFIGIAVVVQSFIRGVMGYPHLPIGCSIAGDSRISGCEKKIYKNRNYQ